MTSMSELILPSSMIVTTALVLLLFLRKRSAALRHWVVATALVCAAVAPLAKTMLPAWEPPFQVPGGELPLAWAGVERTVHAPRMASPTLPDVLQVPASDPTAVASAMDSVRRIWITGVAIMFGVLTVGLLRLLVLTRRARPVTDRRWPDLVDQLRAKYGIRQRVGVLETDRPGLLLVWGWRSPVLLVPESVRTWSEDRIIAVLRHELAHLRRGDWITQIAGEVVRAIYWFNPLVWIACARLHVECERACDDAVLEAGVGGPQYATHLLDIARDLRRGGWWTPAPAIVRTSTLERRVKAMLDRSVDRRPLSRRARHVSLAILLALSLGIATVAATQQFASLTGTIVDSTNAFLPGVTLVLTNNETKAKYEIRTDRNGRYEFVGLPPGTYSLESKLPGFSTFRGAVTVAGQNVNQDLSLSVGMVEETITIVGSDRPAPSDAAEQRAREERKLERQQKVDEQLKKRAASRCPAGASTIGPAIGGNIRTPMKLRDVIPRYPERLRGVEGDVVLSAVIGTDGGVDRVEVLSAANQEFADSLIEAVKQWEFDATLLNCQAIETSMKITGHFHWR